MKYFTIPFKYYAEILAYTLLAVFFLALFIYFIRISELKERTKEKKEKVFEEVASFCFDFQIKGAIFWGLMLIITLIVAFFMWLSK